MNPVTATAVAGEVITLDGTYNFRSTAGYTAVTGKLRDKALYRSDALHKLTETDQQIFRTHNIVRVIDLRGPEELEHAPSALPEEGVETVHHPIFDTTGGVPERNTSFAINSVYRGMVENHADRIAGAVRHIAQAPPGAVLVHCTAGKDRTGVVIATALAAVGVAREEIVADYAASADNLAGEWANNMLEHSATQFGELTDDVRELVTGSPATAIEHTLDLIEETYGSAAQMLLNHGFDEKLLAQLHDRLVG